ncbi:hypothetical protein LPJ61_002176 [Coemansia biformis]|uniref:Transcription elongation factor Eaf N-terminal domain-containing protein n=1 Tax=Coemansia biformis TaxID=1286918 RepID=A0A9W7YF15_9FUNG|nr:hypothetical protein LPJ61_002176 [Coemansia biformis]
MSINLDEQIEYPLRVGASLCGNDRQDEGAESGAEEDGFHVVSRHLPRTTTRVSRETLEGATQLRARFPGGRGSASGKSSLLLEADARDQKSVCTYDGELERISAQASNDDDSDDEVTCLLIYDDELKAFTIEKLASRAEITSGCLSNVAAAGAGASTGMLALPANTHGASSARRKGALRAESRRESDSVADEVMDDELAKELEGLLDNDSDDDGGGGDDAAANSERANRADSARHRDARVDSEELLSAALTRTMDDAMLSEVGSDDDEFEAIGSSKAPDECGESDHDNSGHRSDDDDDDDEMMFEVIDLPTSLGTAPSFSPQSGHIGGSLMEDDSDQFEDVSASRIDSIDSIDSKGAASDDALFADSFPASPMGYTDPHLHQRDPKQHTPAHDTDTPDEFEEVDLDLARSQPGS